MVRRSKETGAALALKVASKFAPTSAPTLNTDDGSSSGTSKGTASLSINYCQYLGSLVTALDRVARIPKLIVESAKALVVGQKKGNASANDTKPGAGMTKKAIVMAALAIAGFARFVFVYKHLFVYALYSTFGIDTLDDYLNRLIHPSYVNKDGPVIHHVPLAAGVPDGNWAPHPQKWRLPADQCPCAVVNEQAYVDETKQTAGVMNQSHPYNGVRDLPIAGYHEALALLQAGAGYDQISKSMQADARASTAEILAKTTNLYINFNTNVHIDESALTWPGFETRGTTSFVSNFKSNGTRMYTGVHGVYFNSLSLQCLGAKRWIFFPEREYRRLNLRFSGKSYVPIVFSDTDLYRSMENVWITKVQPCEVLHFPPGWGHIVWTDDGPNIMTAPRDAFPGGLGSVSIHLWFQLLFTIYDGYTFNSIQTQVKRLLSAKFYQPDPESHVPARVNAAVMDL